MSAFVAIVGWYAAGFLLADRLVLRGHSPVVWWTVAALLGALVVAPALIVVLWRRHADVRVDVVAMGTPASATPALRTSGHGLHLAAIDRPESLANTVGSVPSPVAQRLGRVSLVATVAREAFSPAFETGERATGKAAVRRTRPLAEGDDRLVTSAGADETVRVFELVGVPDLVLVGVGRRPSAARRQVARSIETSLRCAVPVLLVPDTGDRDHRVPAREALTA